MRYLIAAVTVALLAVPAHADTMKNCAAKWNAMAPAAKAATTYKAFSSTCLKSTPAATTTPASSGSAMSGGSMSGPAATAGAPAGATAKCKDGTYSMSKTHSGTCSHHGGVASSL
jgi:uncharacterized protein DUF3761